jgi:hypothetical protein
MLIAVEILERAHHASLAAKDGHFQQNTRDRFLQMPSEIASPLENMVHLLSTIPINLPKIQERRGDLILHTFIFNFLNALGMLMPHASRL